MQQHAIGQVGQNVVAGQMRGTRFDAPVLGDVFVGGEPAAARHRLLLDGDHPAVVQLAHLDEGPLLRDHLQYLADALLDRCADVEAIVGGTRKRETKGVPGLVRCSGRPYILA